MEFYFQVPVYLGQVHCDFSKASMIIFMYKSVHSTMFLSDTHIHTHGKWLCIFYNRLIVYSTVHVHLHAWNAAHTNHWAEEYSNDIIH